MLLWSCVAAVAYSYVLYPVILMGAAKLRRKQEPPDAFVHPNVSVLVAAHNEQRFIEEKVQNTVASSYPQDKLEIAIASDGSSDRTVELVQNLEAANVRLFDYAERRGKATVLNATLPELNGEIVVLSDANTLFEPDAISNLVRWFADPAVDAVCGRLILTDPATGQNVDSLYWRYETYLKKKEARLGALLGANGAIYAIRRSHYVPIPNNSIVDDFVIPLLSKLHFGGRIIYDESAIAYEETPPEIGSEFRRRARIGTGGYQSLALLWRLLSPRFGWTAFAFFSHKVLRWIAPFLLIGALIANVLLLELPFYRWLFAAQVLFYAASFAGAQARGTGLPFRLLRLAGMFTSMNAALFVGFWRWLTLPQTGTWQRTAR
jgi:cellulose synthase/poly-beta-1,6-N-acetylglucosamine synthase-like glycosyltransferase